jgi:GPH family glycoside/pentoside/hexuronide:cation symporter
MIQSFLIFFYTIIAGLSLGSAGLLLLLYGIWNAVNDPLMGYYMDKWKFEKWGRRIPYCNWNSSIYYWFYVFMVGSVDSPNPPLAEIGLKALVSLVPVIGGLLALLVFKFFPLNYDKFMEQQKKLIELHEERLTKLKNL